MYNITLTDRFMSRGDRRCQAQDKSKEETEDDGCLAKKCEMAGKRPSLSCTKPMNATPSRSNSFTIIVGIILHAFDFATQPSRAFVFSFVK